MSAVIEATSNCNISYIDYLSYYGDTPNDMQKALFDCLSVRQYGYWAGGANANAVKYADPKCGMLLFAQGSEHKPDLRPYAHNFKKLIEDAGLGQVIELPPVPNPQHDRKPGILFVWIVKHAKLREWYKHETLRRVGKPIPPKRVRKKVIKKAI